MTEVAKSGASPACLRGEQRAETEICGTCKVMELDGEAVVELPARWCEKHGVKDGDVLEWRTGEDGSIMYRLPKNAGERDPGAPTTPPWSSPTATRNGGARC